MCFVYPKRIPEKAGGTRSKLHKNYLFHSYQYQIGLLEKNQFACSKIILWIVYNWMCSGKLTYLVLEGGKISGECILQKRIHGEWIG